MDLSVVLFLLVGGVAIASAAAMIMQTNAVYSALFLIVNFICVAFLYLMLEASFLSMVQIAVYAGAIMVLFLFVIMLLGAESAESDAPLRRFRWLPVGVVVLAAALLGMLAIAWGNNITPAASAPGQTAFVRVLNAAPATGDPAADPVRAAINDRNFNVYANDTLIAESISYEEVSAYLEVPAGDYTVTVGAGGQESPVRLPLGEVSVEADTLSTLVIGGDRLLSITPVVKTLAPTARNTGRLTLANVYPDGPAVDLVYIESDLFADSRKVTPVLTAIAPGAAATVDLAQGRLENLAVIQAGSAETVREQGSGSNAVLRRFDALDIERETSQIVVYTFSRENGALSPRVLGAVTDETPATFGSPRAVGEELFTGYVLPMQLVAVLLLAAMVGVIVLTHREERAPKPSRLTRRKVSRPLTSVIASQTGTDLSTVPQLSASQPEHPEPAGD